MSDVDETVYLLDFTPEDVQLVETFRRRRDTSVLTIMFTDIEGFTALTEVRGDRAANELRRQHDEIVGAAIEEGGAGQVVKHIGDAVLAVFSEPSSAVERALVIQARLREFNRSREDTDDLLVRIGLHMGQVTTENEVDLDVFGRHVNRASRVEGLARGGQVLLTYPVFDSAQGWLTGEGGAAATWVLHGEYHVKGLVEPIAVYEVYDSAEAQPQRPRGARRKRSRVVLFTAAMGLILVGLTVWLVILLAPGRGKPGPTTQVGPAEPVVTVKLVDMPEAPVYLDHGTRVILNDVPGQRASKAVTKIPVGEHLLHWTYSSGVRYYARIVVAKGDNTLHPRFMSHPLPALSRHVRFPGGEPHRETHSSAARYVTYDVDNQPREHQADLAMSVEIAKDNVDPVKLAFTYNWRIMVDGKQLHADTLTVTSSADSKQTIRDRKIVWQDEFHYYEIQYYTLGSGTQFSVQGGYVPTSGE